MNKLDAEKQYTQQEIRRLLGAIVVGKVPQRIVDGSYQEVVNYKRLLARAHNIPHRTSLLDMQEIHDELIDIYEEIYGDD